MCMDTLVGAVSVHSLRLVILEVKAGYVLCPVVPMVTKAL